jgi:hypothetical protein
MLCGSDGVCDFSVFESLSDEFNDALLSFAGDSFPVAFASEHSCLRYSRVASFTRLIPLVMPNLRNKRLKCALTVRRAIFSCRAISSLSQPCSRRSAICCSLGPSATDCSFIPYPPVNKPQPGPRLGRSIAPNIVFQPRRNHGPMTFQLSYALMVPSCTEIRCDC